MLHHSDTKVSLSVVSARYAVLQPRDVFEFYRDLVDAGSCQLETADVLEDAKTAGRWRVPASPRRSKAMLPAFVIPALVKAKIQPPKAVKLRAISCAVRPTLHRP